MLAVRLRPWLSVPLYHKMIFLSTLFKKIFLEKISRFFQKGIDKTFQMCYYGMGCSCEISSFARPLSDSGGTQKTRATLLRVSTPSRISWRLRFHYNTSRPDCQEKFENFFLKKFSEKYWLCSCSVLQWNGKPTVRSLHSRVCQCRQQARTCVLERTFFRFSKKNVKKVSQD